MTEPRTEPFDPEESDLMQEFNAYTRQMAAGHLTRTGHKLEAYYTPSDTPGVFKMVRTCCQEEK